MKMNRRVIASAPMLVTAFAILLVGGVGTDAQTPAQPAMNVTCPRPTPGAVIQEPEDLRSENGVLAVHVAFRNELDASRQIRYCYVFGAGLQSPNLRLRPGDLLILTLQNDLTSVAASSASVNSNPANISGATRREIKTSSTDPCGDMRMSATSTNLHLRGLTFPPVCHQDDVLKTSIQSGDPPFEYRFRIPADQPPQTRSPVREPAAPVQIHQRAFRRDVAWATPAVGASLAVCPGEFPGWRGAGPKLHHLIHRGQLGVGTHRRRLV
jgi:hypothetical protein